MVRLQAQLFIYLNINMYNLLCRKYTLTKSKRLIFIKHRYDKKEYIVKLLKNNINFYLKEGETYADIVNEILKNDTESYTRYINKFCRDRALNEKTQSKICFHPPCYNKVINDNYCFNHRDKKYENF